VSLKAFDHDAIEFADLAGDAMMGLPDLDSMIFSPGPAFGAGGKGLSLALEPFLPAGERDVDLPSFNVLAIANSLRYFLSRI